MRALFSFASFLKKTQLFIKVHHFFCILPGYLFWLSPRLSARSSAWLSARLSAQLSIQLVSHASQSD